MTHTAAPPANKAPVSCGWSDRIFVVATTTPSVEVSTSHGVSIGTGCRRRCTRAMNRLVPSAVLHSRAERGIRRVRSSPRTMTSSVVTVTRRRHRDAHHMPPHPATINGNLIPNATDT